MAYSNSVRGEPSLRLFSVMLALASEMRTLALWPLLLAISPSRIRMLRMMEFFQQLLAIKHLRSISNGMGVVALLSRRGRAASGYSAARAPWPADIIS